MRSIVIYILVVVSRVASWIVRASVVDEQNKHRQAPAAIYIYIYRQARPVLYMLLMGSQATWDLRISGTGSQA